MRQRDECSPSATWPYSQLNFEELQISCFFLSLSFFLGGVYTCFIFCLILDLEDTTGVGNIRQGLISVAEKSRDNCARLENEKRCEDLTNKLPHREIKESKEHKKVEEKGRKIRRVD